MSFNDRQKAFFKALRFAARWPIRSAQGKLYGVRKGSFFLSFPRVSLRFTLGYFLDAPPGLII